jgi:hypothetical protein
MKCIMFQMVLYFYILSTLVNGQVLEWAACYNGPVNGWDTGLAITVDDSGYVYVTGASEGTNTTSATIKYSPTGSELWVRRFAFTGADLTLDDSNNLYVTGHLTVKMNPEGDTLWTREWPPFSGANRIEIDTEGNIYIGGSILLDSSFEYGLEKLAPDGSINWTKTYSGPANNTDRLNDIVLDSKGNVIVTGQSHGTGTHWDYATVKYSPAGDILWVSRYNGPAPTFPGDYAYAVTVDANDNVYVTGWSDGVNERAECFTIAYSPDGDSLWSHRYPSGGTIGYSGYDIAYDPRGFIYVAARSNGFNDTILKYDLDGNLIRTIVYNTNHTFTPNLARIALDKEGNIYLMSHGEVSSRTDYIVVKYSPEGEMIWEYKYPGEGQTINQAFAIFVDEQSNIYVTGENIGSLCPGSGFDYLTIKLS